MQKWHKKEVVPQRRGTTSQVALLPSLLRMLLLVEWRSRGSRLYWRSSRLIDVRSFYLSFDANDLGRLIRRIRSDGYALVDWANALCVITDANR